MKRKAQGVSRWGASSGSSFPPAHSAWLTKQTALGTKGLLRLTHPGSFRQPCQKRESQHKSPSPTSLKSHRPSQDSATQMDLTNKIIPRATLLVLLVSSCSSGEELPAYNGILQWWWGKWRLSQFVQGGARSWEVVTLTLRKGSDLTPDKSASVCVCVCADTSGGKGMRNHRKEHSIKWVETQSPWYTPDGPSSAYFSCNVSHLKSQEHREKPE